MCDGDSWWKRQRVWDEDPRGHYPYYLQAFEVKNPYFPYSYRSPYNPDVHEESLNPYEVLGFHYIPFTKFGNFLANLGTYIVLHAGY